MGTVGGASAEAGAKAYGTSARGPPACEKFPVGSPGLNPDCEFNGSNEFAAEVVIFGLLHDVRVAAEWSVT